MKNRYARPVPDVDGGAGLQVWRIGAVRDGQRMLHGHRLLLKCVRWYGCMSGYTDIGYGW